VPLRLLYQHAKASQFEESCGHFIRSYLLSQHVIYVGGGNTKSMLAVWREWGLPALPWPSSRPLPAGEQA